MESRFRTWTYTINNYTDSDCKKLDDLQGISYNVYGKEIGESGTPHLQGSVTFKNKKSLIQLKKLFPTAHWEKAISIDDSRNYCMKSNDYKVVDNTCQGKRSDLEDTRDKPMNIIRRDHYTSYVRYHKGILAAKIPEFKPTLEVYWLYGASGSGKTSYANRVLGYSWEDIGMLTADTKGYMFGSYEDQKVLLFDDIRPNDIPFNLLLQYTDIYPVRIRTLGTTIPRQADIIIITSPFHPGTFVPVGENPKQLFRRLTKIIDLDDREVTGGNTASGHQASHIANTTVNVDPQC